MSTGHLKQGTVDKHSIFVGNKSSNNNNITKAIHSMHPEEAISDENAICWDRDMY